MRATIQRARQPLDRWEIGVGEVMGNGDMVVAVVDLVAVRGAHRVACRGSHVLRFAFDGRIAEVSGFVDDQAGLNRLCAS